MPSNEETVQLDVLTARLKRAHQPRQFREIRRALIELDGSIERTPTIPRIRLHYLMGVLYTKVGIAQLNSTTGSESAGPNLAKATGEFGRSVRLVAELRRFTSMGNGARQQATLMDALLLERKATFESQVAHSALKVIDVRADENVTMFSLDCLGGQSQAEITRALSSHHILESRFK